MDIKRICGVVLIVMAVAVAVQTVVEPLYYTSTDEEPYSPLWEVLGWLMFVPLALGVAFAYSRKNAAEGPATETRSRARSSPLTCTSTAACSSASSSPGTGSTSSARDSPP